MKCRKFTNTRALPALILAAFLLLTSVACASNAMTGDKTGGVPGRDNSAGFDSDSGGRPDEGGGSAEEGIDLGRKIITNTNIRMESPDVTKAVGELASYARELGGYIQSQYQTESAGSFYGELVVRIPAESVDSFIIRTENYGEIKENKVSINDVTADYTDTESRLNNARVQEARLLEMFEEADTIDELLYIQSELDRLQERIEVYEGQIRLWDNLIDLATISLYIYEEAALIDAGSSVPRYIPADTVWERFSNGVQASFVKFVNGLSRFVIWLGESFIQLIFFLLLAFVIYKIVKRQRRQKQPDPTSRPLHKIRAGRNKSNPTQAAETDSEKHHDPEES